MFSLTFAHVDGNALTANAELVLARRYLLRDDHGALSETAVELWRRVAHAMARVEAGAADDPLSPSVIEERFFEALRRLEFLPNSPTLMNAGRPGGLGQLAACFVLPVLDSLPQIFDALKWTALIQQTGGGTGFSFSRLRPAGDLVASTHGVASGPVAFIDVFNAATDAIKQGGVRRGANMGILRVDHPDILAFVSAKSDPARMRNFNVSVAITDAFMSALAAGGSYALINPRSGVVEGELEARRVWELITRLAWQSGEPGVVFIDRINDANPTPAEGPMEATNPCGELPLLPFESCNLGSIDVSKLVASPSALAEGGDFDWPRLAELVRLAVRFLDDVIDANRYPLPQIEVITKRNRKIGLGVMGWADALIRMGVPYDSEAALVLADRLAGFIARESIAASEKLAVERGPFPGWDESRWRQEGHAPRRNATTTTIAPTGTISILAGCSGGIEPLYAVSFVREILDGERLTEVHPQFLARAQREGWFAESLMMQVAARGSVAGVAGVPAEVQRLFVTAYDIAPSWHVRMQAAFQRHVENAVSKTINFPGHATVADVQHAYEEAYRLGAKGVTVYRDGSRAGQVLSFGGPKANEAAAAPSASCPECSAMMARAGNCESCPRCGYSRCDR